MGRAWCSCPRQGDQQLTGRGASSSWREWRNHQISLIVFEVCPKNGDISLVAMRLVLSQTKGKVVKTASGSQLGDLHGGLHH